MDTKWKKPTGDECSTNEIVTITDPHRGTVHGVACLRHGGSYGHSLLSTIRAWHMIRCVVLAQSSAAVGTS